MTVHADILRKLVEHGGDVQAAYAATMRASIPREFMNPNIRPALPKQPRPVSDALNEKRECRVEAMRRARDEFLALILPMHHRGDHVGMISEATGRRKEYIREVLRLHGVEPNQMPRYIPKAADHSAIMPEVHPMRRSGVSWLEISRKYGVCRTSLRRTYDQWLERQGIEP